MLLIWSLWLQVNISYTSPQRSISWKTLNNNNKKASWRCVTILKNCKISSLTIIFSQHVRILTPEKVFFVFKFLVIVIKLITMKRIAFVVNMFRAKIIIYLLFKCVKVAFETVPSFEKQKSILTLFLTWYIHEKKNSLIKR